MSAPNNRYFEQLTDEELDFLLQKEDKERRNYYRVFKLLMIVSFVMPFLGAWYRAYEGAPSAFSYSRFFVSVCGLLFVSFWATFFAYRFNLRLLQKDIKQRSKTIDVCCIEQKLHVPHTSTYYLYISSAIKLSIEVSAPDFNLLHEGDEVCIEYSTFSREYFGYF
jgi:hypothetical protein